MKAKLSNRLIAAICFCSVTLTATVADVVPIPRRHPAPPRPIPPPVIRFTARANEKPMTVERYLVDAQVNGLFATVSTTISFGNPNGRVLEGELEFPLPDGASVCGYALDVNGHMRDGVVVKKDEARIAFEAEVKAGVDPGIVEHIKGNMWKTRIYPIPANGARTIRVDYVTPLAFAPSGDVALLLPMPREKIAERKIDIAVPIRANLPPPILGGLGDKRFAQAEAVWRTSAADRDVTPGEDVVVAMPQMPLTFAAVEKTGTECWFAASVAAPPPAESKSDVSAFRILWDASGSRKPADIARAREAIGFLPENARYSLVAFRDVPEAERSFASRAELLAALEGMAYDGGTDFLALAAAVKKSEKGVATILFTDGMDTLSAKTDGISFDALALVSGGEKDIESLRIACGGRVIDLSTATKESVVREIFTPSRFLSGIVGDGVDLVQGIGQMAVGRVIALGRLAADSATIRFDFGGGMLSGPITLSRKDGRDCRTIARARAAKRIAQLSPRADDNADELLALGREYGLASPKTSLIVLDTVEQYLKHKIEPPANEPELHAEWEKRRPAPDQAKKNEAAQATSWLTSLKRDWNERVAWHKDPVPKKSTPKSGLFEDGAAANEERPGVIRRAFNALTGANSAAERRVGSVRRRESADECVVAAEPAPAGAAPAVAGAKKAAGAPKGKSASASVKLAAWDPKTPYLQSLKDCATAHDGKDAPADMLYRRYLELRVKSASSPAFFLDCAGFFFARGEKAIAMRILSNLAELKIEDPALLRTFAWRLREAGEYDRAIPVLRKVAKLRPEEPHSFRDLALLLTERAKAHGSAGDASEAMALLKKTAFTPWKRQNARAVSVFALEELNALADWCGKQKWSGDQPTIPEWDGDCHYLLDMDLRIILSWDADNTDIDIHVLEPNGEEAYYRNRRTASGGFVSQDITTGYGPEEYLQLKGQKGVYKVLTHYYGSSQQRLTGPATATATVYTNWGRAEEKRQILSLRLDKPKEKVTVGEIVFGE